ncbi:kinase-like protein [Mycena sanguinolenta]|nr:kinase-like protein [Mycena sanguinolenta]
MLLRATSKPRLSLYSFSKPFARKVHSTTPPGDVSVLNASSPAVENVELSFVEEPLGLRADQGYGYLQVDFGDRIGPSHGSRPRYEILRKLGWASVWLARDHAEKRYVALKALKGMSTDLHYQGYIQELDIMTRVTELVRRACQPVYCTTLLSHFIHVGKPNDGQHLCLVMEVLAGDVDTLRREFGTLPPPLVKRILRDSLRGLAQLHGSGCAHTDLKADNIMYNIPELTTEGKLSTFIATTPSRRHPPEQSWDYPVQAAVSQPIPPPTVEQVLSGSFRIADLGSAQILTHRVTSHITSETLRAPEVIMQLPWDAKVDIWTFGCLVYEFLLGVPLFSERPTTGTAESDSHLLAEILAVTGESLPVELPSDFVDQYPTTHFSVLVKNRAVALGIPDHDVAGAIDLMGRCLRIDPDCRPTSIQLARQSPWLLELGDDF